MPRVKRSSKKDNPLKSGAIGAVAGSVIGAATGVLLSSEKARSNVGSRLDDVREYAQEAISAMNDMSGSQFKQKRFAGVKGGASRITRKISHLKQGNRKKA